MADNNKPYEVGFGRPPKSGQFKKGDPSANPGGRPKRNKDAIFDRHSYRKILLDTCNEEITISQNGEQKTTTVLAVALKQIAKKAAHGDLKATMFLLDKVQPQCSANDVVLQRIGKGGDKPYLPEGSGEDDDP